MMITLAIQQRQLLDTETTTTLIRAFVSSRVD